MTAALVLPAGWSARAVRPDDVPGLADLVSRLRAHTRGTPSVDIAAIEAVAVGIGSWTRHQLVVLDAEGAIRGWASVHDRAAGRDDLVLHLDRGVPQAQELAASLLDWQEATAIEIARSRDVRETRLELLVDAGDEELQGWLTRHGHHRERRWLNMVRPVAPGESQPGRDGVTVRRVGTHDLGDGTTMPVAQDLQAVHHVLERSFEDHFNSYRESFSEFVQRLREDPGHRWDHWWLAIVDISGEPLIAGAVVCTERPPGPDGRAGSYIEYIGVDRRARGRGVAKSLLATVITDAAARGRNRVGLEVDGDSPTGANGLYSSLGWVTEYVTESWQKDLDTSR